jgi:hypothetical protein
MIKLVFILFLWIIIGIGSPLAVIWSLNTLLNTGIHYGFDTWVATFIIMFVLNRSDISTKKES